MTLQQGLAFGLIGLTIAAFIWGRFRYDVIALCALLAGVALANLFPEARSAGKWLLHGWHVPVGYVAGFFALLLILG